MDVRDTTTLSSASSSASGVTGTTGIPGSAEDHNGSSNGVTGTTGIPESAKNHNGSSNKKLGIILGSVLGGLALVLVSVLIFFLRLWIKQKRPTEAIVATYRDGVTTSSSHLPWQNSTIRSSESFYNQIGDICSPWSPSDMASEPTILVPNRRESQSLRAHRDELRAVRQMEIDQRLQTAQQEIHNLTSRRTTSNGPGLSSSVRQDMEHEMETVHEQIRQLRNQIERLQMERSSVWALGLTDEPPPAYNS